MIAGPRAAPAAVVASVILLLQPAAPPLERVPPHIEVTLRLVNATGPLRVGWDGVEEKADGSQTEGLGSGLVIEVQNGNLTGTVFEPRGADFQGGTQADAPPGAPADGGQPTRERDEEDDEGGDPRDAPPDDGDDPRDVEPPADVCGPDVTIAYLAALERAYERLQGLGDEELGAWDGAHFLNRNGANIDMVARAVLREGAGQDAGVDSRECPRGKCQRTVTLAGHCVTAHVANDIMYGFVVEMLDVPWSIALGGAHAWDLLQYGGLDPNTSKAAYTFGSNLAQWMNQGRPLSEAAFERLMERTTIVEGGFFGAELVSLLELVRRDESQVLDCAPCPEGCTSDLTKDFSKTTWSLSDGRKANWDSGETPPQEAAAPAGASPADNGKECGTAAARFGLCDPRAPANGAARTAETVIDAAANPSALGGPSGRGGSESPVEVVFEGKGQASGEEVFDVHVVLNQSKAGEDTRIVIPPGTRLEPIEDPDSETLERAREIISRAKGAGPGAWRRGVPAIGRPTFRRAGTLAGEAHARSDGITATLSGYCLDRELAAPGEGMLYRIAAPDDQEATAVWLTTLIGASLRIREEGGFSPDSDPDDYYHSIRQWAIWVYAERLDANGFEEALLSHVRKNFAASGQTWTDGTERLVRGLIPNRWSDIQRVIRAAEGM